MPGNNNKNLIHDATINTDALQNQTYYTRMNLIKGLPEKNYAVIAYIFMEIFHFEQ